VNLKKIIIKVYFEKIKSRHNITFKMVLKLTPFACRTGYDGSTEKMLFRTGIYWLLHSIAVNRHFPRSLTGNFLHEGDK
jgi:hypothetical protein